MGLRNSDEGKHNPEDTNSLETLVRAVKEFAGLVGHVLTNATNAVKGPHLLASLASDWLEVNRRLEQLPANSKECMRKVLHRGWFFSWHDSLQTLDQLIDVLLAAPEDQIDEVMTAFYRPRVGEYALRLAERYPNRSAPITAAKNAHMMMCEEGYLLSIPVFIAQGDGLLAEIFGRENALKEVGLLVLKHFANDPATLDLLQPFVDLNDSKFMLTSKKRPSDFEGLNRHQVLHGEVSDYGTEVNSLKAFSFLVFAGLHLPASAPELSRN